ncbi:unannotated protein [freshwater metagenome]|uniref:Unannotated protein n=1 Tax=freshwater metagenome TaxID=449393 RepID=A0A6J6GN31_9ZZZZ
MRQGTNAATCNHRHTHCIGHCAREANIETVTSPISIHRGEKKFPRTARHCIDCPFHDTDVGSSATAMEIDHPLIGWHIPLCIDCAYHALCAKLCRNFRDHSRTLHRCGIHTDLVCSCTQQCSCVRQFSDSPTHSERYKYFVCRATHNIDHGVTSI